MDVKYVAFSPEKCDGCRECEKACSMVHFKNEDGHDHSAIRIFENDGSYEMTVCNHCGLCIDVCPVLALKRTPKGSVLLNKKTCVGCQSCVAFCPRGVMRKSDGEIIPYKCIACGACIRACPEEALYFDEAPLEELREVVYHRQGVCE